MSAGVDVAVPVGVGVAVAVPAGVAAVVDLEPVGYTAPTDVPRVNRPSGVEPGPTPILGTGTAPIHRSVALRDNTVIRDRPRDCVGCNPRVNVFH